MTKSKGKQNFEIGEVVKRALTGKTPAEPKRNGTPSHSVIDSEDRGGPPADLAEAFVAIGGTTLDQHLAHYTRYLAPWQQDQIDYYVKKYANQVEQDSGGHPPQRQVVIVGMIAALRAVIVADYECEQPALP